LNNRVEVAHEPVRFGRYPVVREIGSGGMARVFEARHPELGSPIALKVMHEGLAAQPRAAARFLREARAAAQIRHQHVIQVYDVGTDSGLPYMAMEFLEGVDLASLLREQRTLPAVRVVELLLPVISAVAAAHAAGIIHRDLKPANLMLARRPPRPVHPVVLDFGISKVAAEESEAPLTRSESLLGTLHYMAPELTKGARYASPQSDQYALGVMLYECITGRRPFNGDSHYELMHSAVTAALVPPERLVPDLDPDFSAVILQAMSRDPSARFPSVRALGSALLAFGARHDFALWQDEFLGVPAAVGDRTNADKSTINTTAPSNGELPQASRRPQRLLVGALAAYAVVCTALLLDASGQPAVSATSPGAHESSSRIVPDPRRSPPVMEQPRLAASVEAAPPEIARPEESPTDPPPADGALPGHAKTISPPSAARARPDAPGSAVAKAVEQPLLGTNASPIID
jgi:eukaryotic-like serine/threonine-protein kinase